VRLPPRHPRPARPEPERRCAYLEALADALPGLPLAAAGRFLSGDGSRGRFGSALQWHLGLAEHDALAMLDWEDRIELKLVTVWRDAGGHVVCDKLKVCEARIDPWHKLANALLVYVDRATRVVLTSSRLHLDEGAAAAWGGCDDGDPHFGTGALYVETREGATGSDPAYYLSASWVRAGMPPAVLPLDLRPADEELLGDRRRRAWVVAREGGARCPACGAGIRFDADVLARRGWAPGAHPPRAGKTLAQELPCGGARFAVVEPSVLPALRAPLSVEEHARELAGLFPPTVRLSDRVFEPEDHGHAGDGGSAARLLDP
jgi:hypothetical protein